MHERRVVVVLLLLSGGASGGGAGAGGSSGNDNDDDALTYHDAVPERTVRELRVAVPERGLSIAKAMKRKFQFETLVHEQFTASPPPPHLSHMLS